MRDRVGDENLDALLEKSKDQDGNPADRKGSMPGDLVKAVLERGLESELTSAAIFRRAIRSQQAVRIPVLVAA